MQNEHQIIAEVYAAKEDTDKASQLIQKYLPFIRAEATRCLSGSVPSRTTNTALP